ncbi:MAG: outer membrane lipoprotein-sorting protein [Rhodobiaceae bacterium]|nr:outer membrane lipoprotein-sorting protein [Rhodobiaceae bacterium]
MLIQSAWQRPPETIYVFFGPLRHTLQQTPQYENSGYTRQIGWTDTTDYQVRKSEFYDRKNQLLKTLEFTEYTLHLENIGAPTT